MHEDAARQQLTALYEKQNTPATAAPSAADTPKPAAQNTPPAEPAAKPEPTPTPAKTSTGSLLDAIFPVANADDQPTTNSDPDFYEKLKYGSKGAKREVDIPTYHEYWKRSMDIDKAFIQEKIDLGVTTQSDFERRFRDQYIRDYGPEFGEKEYKRQEAIFLELIKKQNPK